MEMIRSPVTVTASSTCSREFCSLPSVVSVCVSTANSAVPVVIESSVSNLLIVFSPSVYGNKPTMASADFCCPIPISLDTGSQWQNNRPPKVMRVTFPLMPAEYTSAVSVQVLGFKDICLFTHCGRLICDFCSSGQCFAFGFLQIPPRDGHPCRSANRSPCRVDSGLSPPSHPTATMRIGIAPMYIHYIDALIIKQLKVLRVRIYLHRQP
jgi:hypothetical protein